jgi:hypothetical protein
MSPAFSGLQRLFLIFLALWLGLLVWWMNLSMERLEAHNDPRLPFGVISTSKGIVAQDFSYQLLFFRGIRDRLASRVYTMAGQEKLLRQELPGIDSGMSHAYSPVAFILMLPLLGLPGSGSYLVYTVLVTIGIFLLFQFDLFPRAKSFFQLIALLICVTSVCIWADFAAGQSALLTTSLLGAFWVVLRRNAQRSLSSDLLVAVLFWALCLKPSVAIIPLFLLLGARAWRAFEIGLLLILITWFCVADHYGGRWIGLRDYAFLLNNYHNGGMGDFMRRGHQSAVSLGATASIFSLERNLLLVAGVSLLFLRWSRRLNASEHFQAMLGIFLLFSPYLLPSEDWILCLLVVEGSFFQTRNAVQAGIKLLLLAAILDLRFPLVGFDVVFSLKCLLAAWMLWETVSVRSRAGLKMEPTPRKLASLDRARHRFFGSHFTSFMRPDP